MRRGSDAEFGQSIYEPFGISQVECLSAGTISVVSDVCGCRGFVQQVAGESGLGGFIEGAYTQLDEADRASQPIGARERTQAEALQSQVVASTLANQLSSGATGSQKVACRRLCRGPADELGARGRGYVVARFAAAGAVIWLG